VFCDESGTGLTGHITHTWAPAGQTPVLAVVKGRQAKLPVAALARYRPGAGRPALARLIWRTKPGWYHDRELIDLLDQAHQQLAAPMILIWDNLNSHVSQAMTELIAARDWLTVYRLPPYAHELSPVEPVW
jgi:DDE superfamily endonuclease